MCNTFLQLLTVLIIMIPGYGFELAAQSCDTLEDGAILNCIDKFGMKQGSWKMCLKYKPLITSHHDYRNTDPKYLSSACKLVAEGEFKDNQRVGIWSFTKRDHASWLYKTVTYLEDGWIEEINRQSNYGITISPDSTALFGWVATRYDTINYNCKNGICEFELSNGSPLFVRSANNMTELKFELLRLDLEEYDRLIRLRLSGIKD